MGANELAKKILAELDDMAQTYYGESLWSKDDEVEGTVDGLICGMYDEAETVITNIIKEESK